MRYLIVLGALFVFVRLAQTKPEALSTPLIGGIVTIFALVLGTASTGGESDDRRRSSTGRKIDRAIQKVREVVRDDENGDLGDGEDGPVANDNGSSRCSGYRFPPGSQLHWCY